MTTLNHLKSILFILFATSLLTLSAALPALAHVVVKPNEVPTASYQLFTVSVPNERPDSTVAVKILIPDTIASVTPTTKPGWTISTEKSHSGEQAKITAIIWKNGEIKDGLRDDFTFSAKTPDTPTDLQWKAYQTYADGTIVAWDQAADTGHGDTNKTTGPFSVTTVSSDTVDTAADTSAADIAALQSHTDRAFYVGLTAIVLGFIAVFFATRKK